MAPVIGITPSLDETKFYLNKVYVNAIEENGGIPLILGYKSLKNIPKFISMIDGLLMSGGGDMDPSFFGEDPHPKIDFVFKERDEFEIQMYKEAVKAGIPVFGICRGLQVINVAEGGSLIQHIENHSVTDRRNELIHNIKIEQGSILQELMGNTEYGVNTLHHQVLGKLGEKVKVLAKSEDGFIEAVEVAGDSFVMAVQWHPEELYTAHEGHKNLFKHFISKCSK